MPIVVRQATAEDFLRRAGNFLLRSEAENNLILGICADLVANPTGEDNQPWLLTIEQNEAVIGAALMTPPRHFIVTRLSAAARERLVEYLINAGPPIPGVLGPLPDVASLAELWAQRKELRASLAMDQRIYTCECVVPPPFPPVSGLMRAAEPAERELLVAWSRDFHEAVHMADSIPQCRELIDRLIARRAIWVWNDGEPVSCAAFARETAHGVAILHVYTPPERRGHGYASACVAGLTTHLLGSGRSFCCLYTDLANPTSNKIYQQIGYQNVCDSQMFRFG